MNQSEFTIPILFLVFNRPKQTKVVFEKIREIKPKFLYIAADGARENNESDRANCPLVRNIVKEINWDCKVKTLFREKNLGCKIAISSAITWFFNNVEMGIILEDDCLPDISFFYYCKKMLIKYKDDERIMTVSGCNKNIDSDGDYDYFFSSYIQIWGWASWRRAWSKYDVKMSLWPYLKNNLDLYFHNNKERKKRFKRYQESYDNKIDTWDFIWHLTVVINNGLGIIPKNNLVKNIGFVRGGSHVSNPYNPLANLELGSFDNEVVSHPPIIIYSRKFEKYHRMRLSLQYVLSGIRQLIYMIFNH